MKKNLVLSILVFALMYGAPSYADSLGSVTGGVPATQSSLAGCLYTSGTPAPSSGQQIAIHCDANGNILTTGGGGGGGTVTANQGTPNAGGAADSWPVQGAGIAGTPAGGVASVQGVSGGTALPVSAASLPLPSGAATAANQTNVQSAPGTPQTTALSIQGNASAVAVPVSIASLPLPTGAATSALQTTGNTSLSTIATNTTGASTAANQTTGNSSLSTIATNTTNSGTPTIQPCAATGCGIAPSISAINATSLVLKASANALVFDFYCYSSVAGNCILYNATAAPSAGAITASLVAECIPVSANGYGAITEPMTPELLSAGAVVLFSSATGEAGCNTYTVSSTAYIKGRSK